MSVEIIIKIAALGVVIALLNQILKHAGREDQAFFVTLAGIIVVLTWLLPYLVELFETVENLFGL